VSSATSAEQLPLYRPILAASFYSPVFGGRIGCATAPFRRLPFTHGVRERQQRVDLSRSVRLRFDGHREAISHQRRLQTENVGLRPMKFLNPRGQKNGQNGLDLSIDLQSLMDR
jgi:hypothetical protein